MQNPLEVLLPGSLATLTPCQLDAAHADALQDPALTQRLVLRDILHRAAGTDFGRRHCFAQISTPAQYTAALPLSAWADYGPFSQQMEQGIKNLLFPGIAEYFLQTSGTTGQDKHIPQSAAGAAANRAVTCLRSHLRQRAVAGALAGGPTAPLPPGRVLIFPSPRHTGATPAGIPIGFSSGVTAASTPAHLQAMHACPAFIFALEDPSLRDFLILCHALSHADVVAAMGNNPGRLAALLHLANKNAPRLTESIRTGNPACGPLPSGCPPLSLSPNPQRAAELAALLAAGRFSPKYYWPHFNFACFWLSGGMGSLLETLRSQFPPDTLFFDAGYGSSELKINLPYAPGSPYGPPALFAGFYEFLPRGGGPAVTVESLGEGKTYEVVITTYSGLYRYRLGDWVRVQGRVGGTPCIAFAGRTGDVANLAGEKTGGEVLLRAAEDTCHALGLSLVSFGLWPDLSGRRYHCFFELHRGRAQATEWATAFDTTLQMLSAGYLRRRQDGSLTPPAATQMQHGFGVSPMAHGPVGGQFKAPVVLEHPPNATYFLSAPAEA